MHFFNHYSAPIVLALVLAGGLSLVVRRGGKLRHWLILGGALVALVALWLVFRPVAGPAETSLAGQPLWLEVQSPYCLGCVAIKPVVDALENELCGKLTGRGVDIQSAKGRKLASQYGIEVTPTFIFFNTAGRQQWRIAGRLDAVRVRTSLHESAK